MIKAEATFYYILTLLLGTSLVSGQIEPNEKQVYKTISDTELSLHIFYPEDHKTSDSRPAIVLFFGGAWTGGKPSLLYPQAKYLADRGMVTMCAEYRVKSRNKTTPRECVMDGKSAVRWIKKNASKIGVDPEKVLAGGASAGGHVAIAAATLSKFSEEGEDTSISCIPAALVLFNPVYDNSEKAHNLSKSTPPSVTFFGDEDIHHSTEIIHSFHDKAKALGIRADLHLYEGQKHGFFNFGRTEHFKTTLIETDKFLQSLGYLEGEPEIDKIPVAKKKKQKKNLTNPETPSEN